MCCCMPDDYPTIDHYHARTSIVLGAVVIVVQVVAMGLNLLGLNYLNASGFIPNFFTIMQPAVLTAVFIILFGAFAIAAGKTKSKCLIITELVFSIIASVFAFVFIAIAIVALIFDASEYRPGSSQKLAAVIIAALLLVLALTQFILSIVGAVLGGKVLCCSPPATETTFIALSAAPPDSKY